MSAQMAANDRPRFSMRDKSPVLIFEEHHLQKLKKAFSWPSSSSLFSTLSLFQPGAKLLRNRLRNSLASSLLIDPTIRDMNTFVCSDIPSILLGFRRFERQLAQATIAGPPMK